MSVIASHPALPVLRWVVEIVQARDTPEPELRVARQEASERAKVPWPSDLTNSVHYKTVPVSSFQIPAGALTLPHRHNGNATSASGLAIVRDGCGRSVRFHCCDGDGG